MSLTILMAAVFVLGYLAIAFEHTIYVNKAASALLTAVLLWVLLSFGMGDGVGQNGIGAELAEHLAEVSEILFFLLGAMTIVELIDAHDGFRVITDRISTQSVTKLIWIIGTLAFFLSALLDNLTTTIVMISLVAKLIDDKELRWYFAGLVVIAANAGGAWSPIGDVTTTMLWIGGQISALGIMRDVLLPSLVCAMVPMALLSMKFKGRTFSPLTAHASSRHTPALANIDPNTDPMPKQIHALRVDIHDEIQASISPTLRRGILALGLGALAFVPVFKTVTHLPPYMGVLFGLSIVWMVAALTHRQQDDYIKERIGIEGVLKRVDMPSILFFLGILLAVGALATAGILADVAAWLDGHFGNIYVINMLIGLLSSLVDNAPLVAGAMNMYPLATDATIAQATGAEAARLAMFSHDGVFWKFLAYCAGTGGSCLIIGSAAGVAAMGMENISFGWYLKKIAWLALVGYLAGAAVYIAITLLFG